MRIDTFKLLKLYREAGMTQEELARAAGMSRRTLSTIFSEGGEVNKEEYVTGLASALQVNRADLLDNNNLSNSIGDNTSRQHTKGERLKEVREALGLSQAEFAYRWGTDQSNLSKMEKDQRPVGKRLAKDLINNFNLNLGWWETGEGNMFVDPDKRELSVFDEDDYESVFLPYYPVRVQGGLSEMTDPERNYGEAERIRVLIRKGEPVEDNVVFEVEGDSMYPKYSRGTKIRCKRIKKGDWEYMSSGVYAFSYNNLFVVKRIKDNHLSETGTIALHSDNPLVAGSITIPADQIHHIWKVLRIIDSPAD